MKKHLLALSFVLGFWWCGRAQWVSIPDTNFGTWLNTNGYSQCLQGNNVVGWQMDTTCNAVVNATNMYCLSANIQNLTGIEYFAHLQDLNCSFNQLTFLPSLPNSLSSLNCYSNLVSVLSFLPNSITSLGLMNNQLTVLPLLPDSLISLGCDGNQLTALPSLPNSLRSLSCDGDQLTVLPSLPNSLVSLTCNTNHLSALPSLPDSLVFLYCVNNQLTALPPLPNSLTTLHCSTNQLIGLPTLPNSLLGLICYHNQIVNLPSLPDSLRYLDCSVNQLNALPSLPNSLTQLSCNDNQLSSLPELPDSLLYFYCNNNPNLACFPPLKKVKNLYFYNTGINCLPNYPQSNTSSSPIVSSVPLCDSTNINGCPYCHSYFSLFPDTANPGIYNGYNLSYGSNLTSYLWEFGDGDTSTLQYPSHTYAQAGQYYVCLTAGGVDCTNTYCDSSYLVFKTENGLMSQVNILNPTTTAIQPTNSLKGEPLRINPNPASSSVNVSVDEEMLGSTATVYDLTGRKMAAVQLKTANTKLETSSFSSGVYFVTVENEKGRVTKKLVIEK